LPPLQLIKWVRTRWGSMYDLIERLLINKKVKLHYIIISGLIKF